MLVYYIQYIGFRKQLNTICSVMGDGDRQDLKKGI